MHQEEKRTVLPRVVLRRQMAISGGISLVNLMVLSGASLYADIVLVNTKVTHA